MDRENVISNLEQQIRWIEEIECHQFPGWLNVTNAMRDALALLKEQEEYVPLEPVVMYLSHYASPPEMYPGIHTPEQERELWRKTLKSIK